MGVKWGLPVSITLQDSAGERRDTLFDPSLAALSLHADLLAARGVHLMNFLCERGRKE